MDFDDDEESEGDNEQLICSMSGKQWESLTYRIFIDPGACASVLPTDWCNHVNLIKTQQPEAQYFFRVANGKKIYNEGQQLVSMMIREGAMRDMSVTACSIAKAVGSASQMCHAGNRVVSNPSWSPEGSCIEHEQIGGRLWLEEQFGLYVLQVKVAPQEGQTFNTHARHQCFHGQVYP